MEDYTYTSQYATSQTPVKFQKKEKKSFCFLTNKPTGTKKTGEEITATKFWKLESQCIAVKGLRRLRKPNHNWWEG